MQNFQDAVSVYFCLTFIALNHRRTQPFLLLKKLRFRLNAHLPRFRLDAHLLRYRYWPRFDDLIRVTSVIPHVDFDHATIVDMPSFETDENRR